MKRLLLIFIGILFYQNCIGQDLKIKITNKTGFDIDSVAICNRDIGLLKKDASITLECDAITMERGFIMGLPNGTIKGKKRHKEFKECIYDVTSVTSGNYSYDIGMKEDTKGYQLYYKQNLYKE